MNRVWVWVWILSHIFADNKFLSAALPAKKYTVTLIIGILGGFPLIIYGIIQNYNHDWFHDYSFWFGEQFNYWGSLFISLAYVSLIMLIVKSDLFARCKRLLALIGKSALSNYLLQSIICTFIFYGHGLGLFGRVERWQQILIVFGVWIMQILLTHLWMKRFVFGPAEWFWRSLTYWKFQKIRPG